MSEEFNNSSGRENIVAILGYLQRIRLPEEIIDALSNLLARAERADYELRQQGRVPPLDEDIVMVDMPTMRRDEHIRLVKLVEYTVDCPYCNQRKTFKRYPGPEPKCCPDCKPQLKREQKRTRQAKWRGKVKDQSPVIQMPPVQPEIMVDTSTPPMEVVSTSRYFLNGYPASKYQEAIFDAALNGDGDIFVVAAAGSGKSTSGVKIIQLLLESGRLTPQDIVPLAFNRHIMLELKEKLRDTGVSASTIHSIGYRSLAKVYEDKLGEPKNRKYGDLAKQWLENYLLSRRISRKQEPRFWELRDALKDLCDFARLTLTNYTSHHDLLALATRYGIIEEDEDQWLLNGVEWVLEMGQEQFREGGLYDFTDMIWLPYQWNLAIPEFKFILVDEAQDLNALQREFVLRMRARGGRILWVGDPNQSIMGFAGADVNSFYQIRQRTNATPMPLSISYRCPLSHVKLAQELVPEIEARPGAPEGSIDIISESKLITMAQGEDMILCRRTAPLVKMALKFIGAGKPARVRGQDGFGKGLSLMVDTIFKVTNCSFKTFEKGMKKYQKQEVERLQTRENSGSLIETLNDKCAAILAIYNNGRAHDEASFKREIEILFEDSAASIILSTVHRAKGLEANRVFILQPESMPLQWEKQQPWEFEQELHIKYVAHTRAKQSMYFVIDPDNKYAASWHKSNRERFPSSL